MIRVLRGHVLDRLAELPDESVHCVVTSPPYYGLRSYGTEPQVWPDGWRGDLGLEPTLDLYLGHIVEVFREVRRVLRSDGTCWLNIGDSYAASRSYQVADTKHRDVGNSRGSRVQQGFKPKDLMLIPSRVAIRLQDEGWWIRQVNYWIKSAPMPESCTDRSTCAVEWVIHMTKSAKYFYDQEAVKEPDSAQQHHRNILLGAPSLEPSGGLRKPHGKLWGTPETNGSGRNQRNWWKLGPSPFSEWTETVRQVRVEADAPVGGKKRKASPDCPVHGDRPAPVSNALDGEREASLLSRNGHSNGRPERAQQADCERSETSPEPTIWGDSSGLPDLAYSLFAKPHNSESHRTDLAPETNLPCNASDQTADHIGDTLASREHSGSAAHRHESNISSDAAPEAASRSDGNSSEPLKCTCEWYVEKTEKTSHFATFPPELPRRCILAGTSQKGVCPKCGAQWVRVIEKKFTAQTDGCALNATLRAHGQKPMDESNGWEGFPRGTTDAQTIGWRPSCSCDAGDPQPAVILDPFAGAFTTALVADRLARDCIGIELSQEYADMGEARLRADAGMFTSLAAD